MFFDSCHTPHSPILLGVQLYANFRIFCFYNVNPARQQTSFGLPPIYALILQLSAISNTIYFMYQKFLTKHFYLNAYIFANL